MKYDQIWEAVDKLAEVNGLSPSGLAKKAGLDATTFNKSKRVRQNGKKRWPSLESINKIIAACNISFDDFYHLIDDENCEAPTPGQANLPCFELSNFATDSLEQKASFPVQFPGIYSELYAVEIDGKTAEPVYQAGAILIIAGDAEIRRGDRFFVALKNKNETLLGEFINRTTSGIKFYNLTDNRNQDSLKMQDIAKIGRILWVSQ